MLAIYGSIRSHTLTYIWQLKMETLETSFSHVLELLTSDVTKGDKGLRNKNILFQL